MTQEYAMQYYGFFMIAVMLGVMVTVANGGGGRSMIMWSLVAMGIALLMANAMAYAKLRRTYAQIFFVDDHFSLISVYDILYQKENHAFPLNYANPTHHGNEIQLHYADQIVSLKRADWEEDFDLIWNWLNAKPSTPGTYWNTSLTS